MLWKNPTLQAYLAVTSKGGCHQLWSISLPISPHRPFVLLKASFTASQGSGTVVAGNSADKCRVTHKTISHIFHTHNDINKQGIATCRGGKHCHHSVAPRSRQARLLILVRPEEYQDMVNILSKCVLCEMHFITGILHSRSVNSVWSSVDKCFTCAKEGVGQGGHAGRSVTGNFQRQHLKNRQVLYGFCSCAKPRHQALSVLLQDPSL